MEPTRIEFRTHAQKTEFLNTCLVALKTASWKEKSIFQVHSGLDEALVNALRHGNKEDSSKSVRVLFLITSDKCSFEITDEGSGFNPEDVPDPLAPENLERPCGRGILMMRHFMTAVIFEGNKITLIKENSA